MLVQESTGACPRVLGKPLLKFTCEHCKKLLATDLCVNTQFNNLIDKRNNIESKQVVIRKWLL